MRRQCMPLRVIAIALVMGALIFLAAWAAWEDWKEWRRKDGR